MWWRCAASCVRAPGSPRTGPPCEYTEREALQSLHDGAGGLAYSGTQFIQQVRGEALSQLRVSLRRWPALKHSSHPPCVQGETEFIAPDGQVISRDKLPMDAVVVALPAPLQPAGAPAAKAGQLPGSLTLPAADEVQAMSNPPSEATAVKQPAPVNVSGGAFDFHRRKSMSGDSRSLADALGLGDSESDCADLSEAALSHVEALVEGPSGSSLEQASGEPASEDGAAQDPGSAPPPPFIDSHTLEENMLRGLVFAIISATGHALPLHELATAILSKTSLPWASHWAPRHGHLLLFLKGLEAAPPPLGFKPLQVLGNRYVSLQGLPGPALDGPGASSAPPPPPRHATPPPPPGDKAGKTHTGQPQAAHSAPPPPPCTPPPPPSSSHLHPDLNLEGLDLDVLAAMVEEADVAAWDEEEEEGGEGGVAALEGRADSDCPPKHPPSRVLPRRPSGSRRRRHSLHSEGLGGKRPSLSGLSKGVLSRTGSTLDLFTSQSPPSTACLARGGASSSRGGSGIASPAEALRVGALDVEAFAQQVLSSGALDSEDMSWSTFHVALRPLVVHGFQVVKHGRTGGAKPRHMWLSDDLTEVHWRTGRLLDRLMGDTQRSIPMLHVVGVTRGISTQLLCQRASEGGVDAASADTFFSLLTSSRTLDMQAATEAQAAVLAAAFAFLVKQLQHVAKVGVRRGGARLG